MGEPRGHPEHTPVRIAELQPETASIRRRIGADVYDDIPHPPTRHSHQLSLRWSMLIVESTQNARRRARVVVLHKSRRETRLLKLSEVKTLSKEAPLVSM